MDSDTLAALVVGAVVVGAIWGKRETWLAAAGGWLQAHHVTLARGGLVVVPYLGGVDGARLLLAVAAAVLVVVVATAAVRRTRRAQAAAQAEDTAASSRR